MDWLYAPASGSLISLVWRARAPLRTVGRALSTKSVMKSEMNLDGAARHSLIFLFPAPVDSGSAREFPRALRLPSHPLSLSIPDIPTPISRGTRGARSVCLHQRLSLVPYALCRAFRLRERRHLPRLVLHISFGIAGDWRA